MCEVAAPNGLSWCFLCFQALFGLFLKLDGVDSLHCTVSAVCVCAPLWVCLSMLARGEGCTWCCIRCDQNPVCCMCCCVAEERGRATRHGSGQECATWVGCTMELGSLRVVNGTGVTPLHPPRWVMTTTQRYSCQVLLTTTVNTRTLWEQAPHVCTCTHWDMHDHTGTHVLKCFSSSRSDSQHSHVHDTTCGDMFVHFMCTCKYKADSNWPLTQNEGHLILRCVCMCRARPCVCAVTYSHMCLQHFDALVVHVTDG